jgi:hypothetical protein
MVINALDPISAIRFLSVIRESPFRGRFLAGRSKHSIDGSNEYYDNPHVIGIGDRVLFIGAIGIIDK